MQAALEHVNLTVSDAHRTARLLQTLFGWTTRWEGPALSGAGYTVHVGTADDYVALYQQDRQSPAETESYAQTGGLNHIAVVVDDIDAVESNVVASGLKPVNHGNYEPGLRFYFHDHDGVEWEVVSYR